MDKVSANEEREIGVENGEAARNGSGAAGWGVMAARAQEEEEFEEARMAR